MSKAKNPGVQKPPSQKETARKPKKLKRKFYDKELARLQIELVKQQEWIKHKGLKVVVLFEGRDAASKGDLLIALKRS
jgi:polyphosphate kinase 2 (PPK2 family)